MKQTSSIPAAAFLLATGILLSRILGYVREVLLAYKFGANGVTDAFYAAFQIPDLLNYFLSGGALSIAFIPLYNKVLVRDGEEAARALTAAVLGTLGAVVTAATAILWWQAPALIRFQFPHFADDTTELTVHLTRIVLPAQIFFITGGIVQAVLLARRNFMAAALSPLIYNALIIAGGYFLEPFVGIDGFAIGTLAGSFFGPFLLPVIYAWREKPLRMRFAPSDKHFLIYIVLAAPLMFGQTLLTLDEWYGRWFGGLLSAGTVAHLSYARKLMQVPIAVIGQAVAAAALPTLSKLWSEDRVEELNATLTQTLRTGISLAVLAGAGLFAVSGPLVTLVYQQGAFGEEDARTVSILVTIFAFAMPGWVMQQISARAFYARGDTWRPMVLGTVLSLLAIPMYFWFSDLMGVGGLALAGVVGMTVNAAATVVFARKLHGAPPLMPLLYSIGRSVGIAIPSAMVAANAIVARWAYYPVKNTKLAALADAAAGGLGFSVVAVCGILLFGDPPLRHFMMRIFRLREPGRTII